MGDPSMSAWDRTDGPRILVAGMGNVLHRDDGFGVRVLEALAAHHADGSFPLPGTVTIREVGIGGIHLVQELMAGYDVLVLLDAVSGSEQPGAIQVRRMEVPPLEEFTAEERESILGDTHVVVPAKVLLLASALDALPSRVFLVGCSPKRMDLGEGLTPAVEAAVERACHTVRELLEDLAREGDPDARIRIRDEVLQMMYWMQGEGLAREPTAGELRRFLGPDHGGIRLPDAIHDLEKAGLVVRLDGGRLRLTDEGRREGGRRFADEFQGLTGQAHGECIDPDCDCHTDPAAAVECLAGRGGQAHSHG